MPKASKVVKIQQPTIYIDKNGKRKTTNEKSLSSSDNIKEIVQIGFYKNEDEEIQTVRLGNGIDKIPNQLPPEITSLKEMFMLVTNFNGDISKWDTSHVKNMANMFRNASSFNQNLANWNTSRVTSMVGMFTEASLFNQDISNWDTSHVTNMTNMFRDASSFNSNIGDWDVSKVKIMNYMFWGASSFNQNLSHWNVDKVTEHIDFATDSAITEVNKLPKWK